MFWFHGCITAISTDNLYTLDVYICLSNLYKELQANLGVRILSLPYLKIYLTNIYKHYRAYYSDIVLSINSLNSEVTQLVKGIATIQSRKACYTVPAFNHMECCLPLDGVCIYSARV